MQVNDSQDRIENFIAEKGANDRLASYDYCFNYFHSHREGGLLRDTKKVVFISPPTWPVGECTRVLPSC